MEVWQFYVFGKKPHKLSGARNDLVKVYFKDQASSELPPVGKFSPSRPKMINGRWYSGKSTDYMAEFNVAAANVEKVIAGGDVKQKGKYYFYYWLRDNSDVGLTWVEVDEDGRVVLVGN